MDRHSFSTSPPPLIELKHSSLVLRDQVKIWSSSFSGIKNPLRQTVSRGIEMIFEGLIELEFLSNSLTAFESTMKTLSLFET